MKPLGPVPDGYTAKNGELAISGIAAGELVRQAGDTPLFVYSADLISSRIRQLRAALPARIAINYAIKANPFDDVLKLMAGLVDGFDIASGGELDIALRAGLDPALISFAGPGKRDSELEKAIASGVTLNLESEHEARRALAIAERIGKRPKLAIRVNPHFELRGSGMKMGGGAKQFGIDQERVPALAREIIGAGAEWRGLHIFTGSQALDAGAIGETQANVLDLAAELSCAIGVPLPKLNMGGGFGIPYFSNDKPLDIAAVGAALAQHLANLPEPIENTELCVELGRYLVGEAGVYLTRIVDKKVSQGETFLITDGGLHHQLAASGNFGTVVRRNYPVAIASNFNGTELEEVNVVGCLCTPLDRLADKAELPAAQIGDLVAVFCAGAYGATASPFEFLGQGAARQMLV
ncbi:pyridoxal-dependent decarboxylase, exosortase A system-associated [Altererythrobacter aquiaggeris]|uniref:pyridoxal-dependent decarboxylase, exosortase A system-associated n=1 Tax=Aestuarierythrobacter aquiaggeris TaxID=1898396 RepID=UPI0030160C6E